MTTEEATEADLDDQSLTSAQPTAEPSPADDPAIHWIVGLGVLAAVVGLGASYVFD